MIATDRLPGVYFVPPPSQQDEVLPRMDIALFVGFASRGALNQPMVVEDAAQFAALFGDDVELCRDEERGEIVYGYLGAAVRAFFRNGGRRCWVARVQHAPADQPHALLEFNADLFFDPRLRGASSSYELETLATFYRGQQPGRAKFQGIHAALDPGQDCDMDEVTLIAVPDAIHLGWHQAQVPKLEPPEPSAPLEHPAWWHFLGCPPAADSPLPEEVRLAAPILHTASIGENKTLQINWMWTSSGAFAASPRYLLQQARVPDWRDAQVIYRGSAPTFTTHVAQPGDYYYRVRVVSSFKTSPWSNAIRVQASGARTGPDRAEFQRCDLAVLSAPELLDVDTRASDQVALQWTWKIPGGLAWTPPDPHAPEPNPLVPLLPVRAWTPVFVVQEARFRDWRDAAEIYRGSELGLELHGRQPGHYHYRVRALARGETSDWSNGQSVAVIAPRQLVQNEFGPTRVLNEIHKKLLLVCATRGDCFAVLSLPRAMRANDASRYVRKLRAAVDERASSFGAVYHPWLYGRDELNPETVRAVPPDGALCGAMAARAAKRGAWGAPANEPLQNVFALDPHVRVQELDALARDGLNVVIHAPRGFLTLSAQTLSTDADWRDISVRRLICLLRRLALKHGVRYVFEPNSAVFRRAIQQGFENLLRQMFLKGAFAGRAAPEAYQVVVDERVNTRQQMDLGQLVVELRVAPSRPLKFLTVQLVQSHDQTLVQEAV